jgi:16S rRNA (guanine527-N7)-methyltransferase
LTPEKIIEKGAAQIGIEVGAAALTATLKHLDLIRSWNNKLNLTTNIDIKTAPIYHFLDSITICKIYFPQPGATLLDVGSGAGFPGIPVRALCPWIRLSLMDKSAKKIVFMKRVCHEIGFNNVRFINMTLEALIRKGVSVHQDLHKESEEQWGRLGEGDGLPLHPNRAQSRLKPGELLRKDNGQKYDAVVSRAFSSDPSTLAAMGRLVMDGGSLIAMLGPAQIVDFQAPQGFEEMDAWEGELPFTNAYRKVVRMEKKTCLSLD